MEGRRTIRGMSSRAVCAAFVAAMLLVASGREARPDPAEDNYCNQAGESPDIIVADISGDHIVQDVHRWGTLNGITAYSFSGTSCNIGTCWADWFMDDNTHPVIAQNMFQLKDGRFQQIGQSWVKHAWGSDVGNMCGTCNPGDYSHMGVNCSDLYDTTGNGLQHRLGDKVEINPYNGYYPFPQAALNTTGNAIYKRLQVHNSDLDPALSPGSKYFVEMQYLQYQDASLQNGANNASYRPVTVTGNNVNSIYNITLAGETHISQPAITAWKAADPSVILTTAGLSSDGTLYLGTKVTYRGGGIWRYEYAIQNLNAAWAPLALQVPIPAGVTVTGSGYHDVDYHSDSKQDNGAWGRTTTATAVQWKANTLVINGLVPNRLRWGTLYNFRVDANAPPGTHAILLGYNEPPLPTYGVSLSIPTLTPSVCDTDGICDAGETCASCPADCSAQGGGSGCCGNGSCEVGETEAICFADCGQALAAESMCGDGIDGDRDGLVDCFDSDCCRDTACDGFDLDGDGFALCDCNDASGVAWGVPGEATDMHVYHYGVGYTLFLWAPPADPGGSADYFDLVRSTNPSDFSAGTCIWVDPLMSNANDPEDPPAGSAFFYLSRAKNACPAVGPLGSSSSGVPHSAPSCF